MIGLVATLTTQDGKGPELEAIFRELTAQVKANEPGCLTYQLLRNKKDPNSFRVIEFYRDDEAMKAHMESAHFQAANPKIGATLDGRAVLERYDAVE